jgi:hypothetical protein
MASVPTPEADTQVPPPPQTGGADAAAQTPPQESGSWRIVSLILRGCGIILVAVFVFIFVYILVFGIPGFG